MALLRNKARGDKIASPLSVAVCVLGTQEIQSIAPAYRRPRECPAKGFHSGGSNTTNNEKSTMTIHSDRYLLEKKVDISSQNKLAVVGIYLCFNVLGVNLPSRPPIQKTREKTQEIGKKACQKNWNKRWWI